MTKAHITFLYYINIMHKIEAKNALQNVTNISIYFPNFLNIRLRNLLKNNANTHSVVTVSTGKNSVLLQMVVYRQQQFQTDFFL